MPPYTGIRPGDGVTPGSVDEADLSFDPATQAELNAVLLSLDARLDALEGAPAPDPGALVVIDQRVLSGAAASISFTGIPDDYETLRLEVVGRTSASAAIESLRVRFNNDSTVNYDFHYLRATNTTAAGGPATEEDSGYMGSLSAANATASLAGACVLTVPGYARTTFKKQALFQSSVYSSEVSSGLIDEAGGFVWRTANAAINRLDIFVASTMIAGTVATLYGVGA